MSDLRFSPIPPGLNRRGVVVTGGAPFNSSRDDTSFCRHDSRAGGFERFADTEAALTPRLRLKVWGPSIVAGPRETRVCET